MAGQSLFAAAVVFSLAASAAAAPNGTTLRGAAAAAGRGSAPGLAAASQCSPSWGACLSSRCCVAGYACYEKDTTYAQCQPADQCEPGIHPNDPVPTYWSCHPLARGPPDAPPGCSSSWGSCQLTRCCSAGYACYQKDNTYAQCQPAGQCVPGVHADDPVKTPWSCAVLSPSGPPPPGPPATPAPPAPTAPPEPTSAPPTCQDFDPSCPGWAAIGQCEKNPPYMIPYCPLSCGVCV